MKKGNSESRSLSNAGISSPAEGVSGEDCCNTVVTIHY